MALKHIRAAQERTKTKDPIARSVIQVIATDIGHDDSPAYPSYRTIAERAGCHYNTVADKVKELCDNGDLIVTKRGKYNLYSLPYDCSDYARSKDYHTPEGDNDEKDYHTPEGDNQYVTKDELAEILSHSLSHFAEELSQRLSQIVIAQGVTEETKEKKDKEELPAGAGAITNEAKPYDVYQALLGIEPGMKKGQSLREIKVLLDGDPSKNISAYSPSDIVGCGRFLQTDPWRVKNMVTLTTQHIMEKIDKWVAADRPRDWEEWQHAAPDGTGEQQSRFLPKGHQVQPMQGTDW